MNPIDHKDHENLQLAVGAVNCYLQASGLHKNRKAQKLLIQIFDLVDVILVCMTQYSINGGEVALDGMPKIELNCLRSCQPMLILHQPTPSLH